jgi:uncharacterized protein YndB with AHSA1/START domain
MAVIHERVHRSPEAVFDVLLDPARYPDWLVGAKAIRAVDATWPSPGSRFHHRVGAGPLTIEDSTVLEALDPPRTLTLRARARPAGVARVTLRLTGTADGGTDVEMEERPVSGPARWLDNPLLEAAVAARNRKSLRRLARLVTGAA